ncbi:DUF7351 domain-containing protein [Halomicrococcus sp. SG-WS-1]|uniref:DUF7351 domain-containing protein n=1 Tax=Halomicrococcus sp. SG-WS-1 TaxID=3439057 RepID=UPI003F79251A
MPDNASVSPEDAFSVLGNELRTAILQAFAEAERDGTNGLTFTAIYDRVPVDSTSQLSYHLDMLDEIFLYKDDQEYALTQAGDKVVRAILSGTYSERPSFESTRLEGRCPACESVSLRADYRERGLVVVCTDCDTQIVVYDLPPAEAKDRSSTEILRSCDQRIHHEYATALRGTCTACGGRTSVEIDSEDGPGSTEHYCIARCRSCYRQVFAPLYVRLLYHPAVVVFYWKRDVDISSVPFWEISEYVRNWSTEVIEECPFRAHVTVAYEDAETQLTVDGTLDVSLPTSRGSKPDT